VRSGSPLVLKRTAPHAHPPSRIKSLLVIAAD
jgi:hypothetical protein